MPPDVLIISESSTSPHLKLNGTIKADGAFTINTVTIGTIDIPVSGDDLEKAKVDQFVKSATGEWRMISNATLSIGRTYSVTATNTSPVLGLAALQLAAQISFDLTITDGKPALSLPTGDVVMATLGGSGSASFFGLAATIDFQFDLSMPHIEQVHVGLKLKYSRPGLTLPDIQLPRISLPKIPDFLDALPAINLYVSGVHVSWDAIELTWTNGVATKLKVSKFKLSLDALDGVWLEGDMECDYDTTTHKTTSTWSLTHPKATFTFNGFFWDGSNVIVDASLTEATGLLDSFSFGAKIDEAPSGFKFRGMKTVAGIELRLDFKLPSGVDKRFTMGGLSLAGGDFVSVARMPNGAIRTYLTMPAASKFQLGVGFVWGGSADRQATAGNDGQRDLLDLAFERTGSSGTVMVAQFGTGGLAFLQKCDPISQLDVARPVFTPCPEPQGLIGLGDGWKLEVAINAFDLPFLNAAKDVYKQLLQVQSLAKKLIEVWEDKIPLELGFSVSPFDLSLKATVTLQLSTMSLVLEGDKIQLLSDQSAFELNILSLTATLKGVPVADKKFAYLDLIIKGGHSSLALSTAAGGGQAKFSLSWNKLGSELPFDVTYFAITEKGIDLDAMTRPVPVRLAGVDTDFTFKESKLSIRGNAFSGSFALSGSGSLPSALIDDGHVEITISFSTNGNDIQVAGGCVVKFEKALVCKATRFEFAVHGIGLGFQYDEASGQVHFYFKLTATAKFALAPGDASDGPLSFLPNIELDLIDCPLVSDLRVLGHYIHPLVQFQKYKVFKLLGCFEFELRGFGFFPSCPECGGRAAVAISGQIKFSDGAGDAIDAEFDFHTLYIGLPAPGSSFPQVAVEDAAVHVHLGDAFKIGGTVRYEDKDNLKGFAGNGTIEIAGLPGISVGFAFMRLRTPSGEWVRAWFLAINLTQLSIEIYPPYLYLREVGLGFGYRYTITVIQEANKEESIRALLGVLDRELRKGIQFSDIENWDALTTQDQAVFTIAIHGLFSQSCGTSGQYDDEKDISCLFLFDVVIALTSDLTLFSSGNSWFCTNVHDYSSSLAVRSNPFLTSFILLQARRQRFLTHMAKVEGATFGDHPPLPSFMKSALASCQFSMTLLIEWGQFLFQFEAGWPNLLRWKEQLLGFTAEFRGGFICRITSDCLVTGVSFLATANFQFQGGLDLGFIGAQVSASVSVAYGGRYVGQLAYKHFRDSYLYAAIGMEVKAAFSIRFWLHIDLWLFSIDIDITFSINFNVTAAMELAISPAGLGVSGNAVVEFGVFGHSLRIGVHIGVNDGFVASTRDKVAALMALGFEATDADQIPGLPSPGPLTALRGEGPQELALDLAEPEETYSPSGVPKFSAFHLPGDNGTGYFVLFPQAGEHGFLPLPSPDVPGTPATPATPNERIVLQAAFPASATTTYTRFGPSAGADPLAWPIPDTVLFSGTPGSQLTAAKNVNTNTAGGPEDKKITLYKWISACYVMQGLTYCEPTDGSTDTTPVELIDRRVQTAADADFDAAVRLTTQNGRAPYFKLDPYGNTYDAGLRSAFFGGNQVNTDALKVDELSEQALHLRGQVIHDMIEGFKAFVAANENPATLSENQKLPLTLGMIFKYQGGVPDWLRERVAGATIQSLFPVNKGEAKTVDITVVNPMDWQFTDAKLTFSGERVLSHSNTIALDWNLSWPYPEKLDDHIMQYEVSRVSLDDLEPHMVTSIKPGRAVYVTQDTKTTTRLLSRFKFVDHFTDSWLSTEKRYVYTVTPIDFAGKRSPYTLTVRASRLPSTPPLPPTEVQIQLTHDFTSGLPTGTHPDVPEAVKPTVATLTFVQPKPTDNPTATSYRLYFRPVGELPIGSYGLDADGDQAPSAVLPSSLGAPLDGDLALDVGLEGKLNINDLLTLLNYEAGASAWRPAGWTVYLCAITHFTGEESFELNSTLTPANIVLDFLLPSKGEKSVPNKKRFRPSHIELLAEQIKYPLVSMADVTGQTGNAFVPVVEAAAQFFDSGADPLGKIAYRLRPPQKPGESEFEPAQAFGFTWKVGSSQIGGGPREPLLYSAYKIWELDAYAHTEAVFSSPSAIVQELRHLSTLKLVPRQDLVLSPRDTLAPSQWEAWYPNFDKERNWLDAKGEPTADLIWPPLSLFGVKGCDLLQQIVDAMGGKPDDPQAKFGVRKQARVTSKATTIADFMAECGSNSDPYGWSIIDRLGCSATFNLFNSELGQTANWETTMGRLRGAIQLVAKANPDLWKDLCKHLHVELLVQPGAGVQVEGPPRNLSGDDLLAIVQISLRPTWQKRTEPSRSIEDLDILLNRVQGGYKKTDLKPLQESYLRWALRFLTTASPADHPADETPEALAWLAVAYPRSGKPEVATPGNDNEVGYTHMRTDDWNGAYRYYVQASGRYSDLWDVLNGAANKDGKDDPALLSLVAPPTEDLIHIEEGTDLFSPRVRNIQPPGFVRFGRIVDPNFAPVLGSADDERRARIVELILPRHPEELLSDANTTLRLKLGFGQVTVSPRIRFAYSKVIAWMKPSIGDGAVTYAERELDPVNGAFIANDDPQIGQVEEEVLALPARTSPYQRGLNVYQFENVPHFRELSVTITASTLKARVGDPYAKGLAASIEAKTQDLEATAPMPSATLDKTGTGPVCVALRLNNFWDSTPDHVKKRWKQEDPSRNSSPPVIPPSAMPDCEVVYEFYEQIGQTNKLVGRLRFENGPNDSLAEGLNFEIVGNKADSPFESASVTITPKVAAGVEPRFICGLPLRSAAGFSFLYWTRDAGTERALVWTGNSPNTAITEIQAARAALNGLGVVSSTLRAAFDALIGRVLMDGPAWQKNYQFAAPYRPLTPPATLEKAKNVVTGTKITGISWTGALTSKVDDLKLIAEWGAITEYTAAVGELVARKSAPFTQAVADAANTNRPPTGPVPSFEAHLKFDAGLKQLAWIGGLATEAELAELDKPTKTWDGEFMAALAEVEKTLNAAIEISMNPPAPVDLSTGPLTGVGIPGNTNLSIRTSSKEPTPSDPEFEIWRELSIAGAVPRLGQLTVVAKRHGMMLAPQAINVTEKP